MECKSIRARADTTDDGRLVVSLVLGNMRRVGSVDEVAWAEMPPSMAREIARLLMESAAEVEKKEADRWTRSQSRKAEEPKA